MTKGLQMDSRATQIPEQLECLTKSSRELEELIVQLEDRLSSVLRDRQPKDETVEKAMEVVPLANAIRGNYWTVVNVITNIRSILERLEL